MVGQHTRARWRARTPHHLLEPVVRCPATLGLRGSDSEPESSFTWCWHEEGSRLDVHVLLAAQPPCTLPRCPTHTHLGLLIGVLSFSIAEEAVA